MYAQFLLSGAIRKLEADLKYLSAPCQTKVLLELRQMILVMKEQVEFHRSAFAFQVLLSKM